MTDEELQEIRALADSGYAYSYDARRVLVHIDQQAAELEKLRAKADSYERDWYAAKSEFGDNMARVNKERDALKRENAALRKVADAACVVEKEWRIGTRGMAYTHFMIHTLRPVIDALDREKESSTPKEEPGDAK